MQEKRGKITKLDETCIYIEAQAATVKRNVHRFTENLMAVIEAGKMEILNKVDIQANESVELLRTQQCEVGNQVKLSEAAIEKTETLLKQGSSAEIVQLDKLTLNTMFQEGDGDEGQQVDCDLERLRQFVFLQNETLMAKLNTEGIGSFRTFVNNTKAQQSSAEGKGIREATVGLEAQFVLKTRNAKGEQCYEERDCVTVEIKNPQGHDCATKARVQDNKDGSYKISYFVKETGKCFVSVNEEHIRGSPFDVQVKSRQFRPVLSFGEYGRSAGQLASPWGVAVNERNEIAVADAGNNRVQVFTSDGTQVRSFGRKGDKPGEFNLPSCIAFDTNSNIIVANNNNHRVQVFSEQGEYLNQFGEQGSLDHQLKYPNGVSVDSDGNIIVADSGNKLIKMFSLSGQFLRKIGGEGSLTFPFHCVEYDKYLIVSDSNEHCIKMFSRDGNFLYKFGKQGEGDGEFNRPCYLSINKAGHLMVCDELNHRVQVFELSGKFVTKFGTKGSGIGEFYHPFSTAVLGDSRIVVSDWRNHRIQIFQ